jgi:hydrogenase maturation protease
MSAPVVVVAGLGSEYRLDDGVGGVVAASIAASTLSALDIGPISEPLDLLGPWNDADLAIVIDATRSGAAPGTIRVVEVHVDDEGGEGGDEIASGETSTHGIGLAGALRLARALHQAPSRLVVVGIGGERFGFGEGLSALVAAAVPEAVRRAVELIEEVRTCV